MSKIVVIDLETTGLDPVKDSIIEVGIAMVDLETGITTELFSSACRERHTILTGLEWIFSHSDLTFEEVIRAPYFESLKETIETLLNTYPATSYNQEFDFKFLETRGITIKNKFWCPMLKLTPIMNLPFRNGDLGKYPSLQEAYNYFFPDNEKKEAHRALQDANMASKLIYQINTLEVVV